MPFSEDLLNHPEKLRAFTEQPGSLDEVRALPAPLQVKILSIEQAGYYLVQNGEDQKPFADMVSHMTLDQQATVLASRGVVFRLAEVDASIVMNMLRAMKTADQAKILSRQGMIYDLILIQEDPVVGNVIELIGGMDKEQQVAVLSSPKALHELTGRGDTDHAKTIMRILEGLEPAQHVKILSARDAFSALITAPEDSGFYEFFCRMKPEHQNAILTSPMVTAERELLHTMGGRWAKTIEKYFAAAQTMTQEHGSGPTGPSEGP